MGQVCKREKAWDHRRTRRERHGMSEWISGDEAATILGVSRSTVYRSLTDEDERARQWGTENVGWRYKPLSRRLIFQVSRTRTEQIAAGQPAAE